MSMSILNGLRMVCLESTEEKLYIANSDEISKMIVQLYMSDFYPGIHCDKHFIRQCNLEFKLDEDQKRIQKEE